MAVGVVDVLEVVDVHQAESEGVAVLFRLRELALQTFVKVAVVPPPVVMSCVVMDAVGAELPAGTLTLNACDVKGTGWLPTSNTVSWSTAAV